MQHIVAKVKSQGNRIELLWVKAHGNPQALQLGKNKYLTARKKRKFKDLANQLEPKAPIVFSACSTGAPGGLASSLAKEIGDRTIYASIRPFDHHQLWVNCKKGFKVSIKEFRWENFTPKRAKCLANIGLIILEILHLLCFRHFFCERNRSELFKSSS